MSSKAVGRVLDQNSDPIKGGLSAAIRDLSRALPPYDIGRAPIDEADGTFSVTYPDIGFLSGPRTLTLVVQSVIGREIQVVPLVDVAGTLDFGTIRISLANVTGWETTLGGDTPVAVSSGNAIRIMADNVEAWGYIADKIAGATSSVKFMQLFFNINTFDNDRSKEEPDIVLKFDGLPPYTAGNINHRLERLLLDAARGPNRVESRILLCRPVADLASTRLPLINILIGLLVWLLNLIYRPQALETYSAVSKYFHKALELYTDDTTRKIDVRSFDVSHFSRTHAKLFFFDDTEAVSLGSPFVQGYFDAPAHAIDNPQRGEAWHVPVHDVSCSVRGPAVREMHITFREHWNKAAPDHKLDDIPPAGPATPLADELPARLQIVRTLEAAMVPEVPAGEQGVLEAYLRALEMAEQFFYFQNQYFTDDTLADALVETLRIKPSLQVIMVLPIAPDLPRYSHWQWGLVNRVRQGVASAYGGNYDDHIEFFGRWTHEVYQRHEPGIAQATIVRDYIHAKVALADNRWGTVGSANLDGQSLTAGQIAQPIQPRIHRNTEVNCVILPTNAIPTAEPAVDHLRRRLWAEDLGYTVGSDLNALDLNNVALDNPPPGGWLSLFKIRADEKLAKLNSSPETIHPARLLRFPPLHKSAQFGEDLAGSTAHLLALGVESRLFNGVPGSSLTVLADVYPYSFTFGKFLSAQPLDSASQGFDVPAGLI
jgi:phosphatidylserine/phosphatidylglycerophosphate/cardiolipin synthase-like enzyme